MFPNPICTKVACKGDLDSMNRKTLEDLVTKAE